MHTLVVLIIACMHTDIYIHAHFIITHRDMYMHTHMHMHAWEHIHRPKHAMHTHGHSLPQACTNKHAHTAEAPTH